MLIFLIHFFFLKSRFRHNHNMAFNTCCVMGAGGCNNMALGSTSGNFSVSGKLAARASASSSKPCVAAVRYASDSEETCHVY